MEPLSPDDPFGSPKYFIEYAKSSFADFHRQVTEFNRSEPFSRIVETDPQTGEQVHKFKLVKPMPPALPGIASNIITNLRSALDQTMLVVHAGSYGHFPIRDDGPAFDREIGGKTFKSLNADIATAIKTYKPYKGGNDPLWALNKIANTDKHAVLTPFGAVNHTMHIKSMSINGPADVSFMPVWDSSKHEMILARIKPGGTFHADLSVIGYIAFEKPDILRGEEALAVLNYFANMVEDIVLTLESEARRIGLL